MFWAHKGQNSLSSPQGRVSAMIPLENPGGRFRTVRPFKACGGLLWGRLYKPACVARSVAKAKELLPLRGWGFPPDPELLGQSTKATESRNPVSTHHDFYVHKTGHLMVCTLLHCFISSASASLQCVHTTSQALDGPVTLSCANDSADSSTRTWMLDPCLSRWQRGGSGEEPRPRIAGGAHVAQDGPQVGELRALVPKWLQVAISPSPHWEGAGQAYSDSRDSSGYRAPLKAVSHWNLPQDPRSCILGIPGEPLGNPKLSKETGLWSRLGW